MITLIDVQINSLYLYYTKELIKNCSLHFEQLTNLRKEYELAKIGLEIQESKEKEIANQILSDNIFTASEDCESIKAGDRITRDEDTFLMSDADFTRFLNLTTAADAAAGITTEDGTYINNWLVKMVAAKKSLVNFILDKIVPASLRGQLEGCRTSVVYQDKLIAAIDKCVK